MSKEHEIQFGTLSPDGELTNVRMIKHSDIGRCPFLIMVPGHYREDGTCKCNDPEERKMMIREWGYKATDFPDTMKGTRVRFRSLTGDVNWMDYGAKWVSQKLNNGEFDYWLVLEFINMDEACGPDNDGKPKYHVCVSAVSPQEAGEKGLESAFRCCGVEGKGSEETRANLLVQVECLHSYGISAPVWQGDGKNARALLKKARKQANASVTVFGAAMNEPKNKIGSTGWEFLRGDLNSGLARTIASGSATGRILAKMHGIDPDDVKEGK